MKNKGGMNVSEEGVKGSKNGTKVNEERVKGSKNGIKVNEERVKGSKDGIKTNREAVKVNGERRQIVEDKIKVSRNLEEDPGFELLKRVITESTGFNCEQYKEAHFKRRINVRVRATNSENYEEYLRLLKKNSAEHENLIKTLTINVSEFFRNPETFGVIEKEIIPFLINPDQIHL